MRILEECGFSSEAQTAIDTWNEQMGVSGTTGNITTNGTITAAGNISSTAGVTGVVGTFSWIACTGASGRPLTPTAQGVYIGSASIGSTAIELCSTGNQ